MDTIISPGLLILNIIMAAVAIGAFFIAKHSLTETQKTRRDSFLPLIVPLGIGWESKTIEKQGELAIINWGRGPAWRITIEYPFGKKNEIIKFLDHGKYNRTNAILPWPDFSKVNSEFMLTIIYNDTFKRCLKVSFRVTVVENNQGKKVLKYDQKDGFELKLPNS